MAVLESLTKKESGDRVSRQALAWRVGQPKTIDIEQHPDTTIESAINNVNQTQQIIKQEFNLKTDEEAREVTKELVTDKTIATIDSAREDGIITPDEQDDT